MEQNINRLQPEEQTPVRLLDTPRPRLIPISGEACDVLRAHLGRTPRAEYVFESTKPGRPIAAIQNAWNRVKRMSRLDHDQTVVVHTLRHTWANQALRAGVPIHEVSLALGHSSVAVTEHNYAHVLLTPSTRRSAADIGARMASFGKRAA